MADLQKTAENFWRAFDSSMQVDSPLSLGDPTEIYRLRCLLGFTALDASLSIFWREEIYPEWDEYVCLIQQLLTDSSALEEMVSMTQPALNRSQWMASLRFLVHTGDPQKFSPSFTDVGILLLLWAGPRLHRPSFQDFVASLFKMQKIRNACVHTAREFSDISGFEGLRLLSEFREQAAQVSPLFHHLNTSEVKVPFGKAA